jgi:hypothetical protein
VIASVVVLALVAGTALTVRALDHGNDVAVTSGSGRSHGWSAFCRQADVVDAGLQRGRAGDEQWRRANYRRLALAAPDRLVRRSILELVERPTVGAVGEAVARRKLALVTLDQVSVDHCGAAVAGVFGPGSPFSVPTTTTTTPSVTSTPQPTTTSTLPPTTTHAPVADVTSGIYVNGGQGTPHYYASVTAGPGGTVDGLVGFLYQDGQTKTVFTFTGTAQGGVMDVTASPAEPGLSITYGPDSLQLGACTSYLQFATSLAECTFRISSGGIAGG